MKQSQEPIQLLAGVTTFPLPTKIKKKKEKIIRWVIMLAQMLITLIFYCLTQNVKYSIKNITQKQTRNTIVKAQVHNDRRVREAVIALSGSWELYRQL